jgi:hypothetical protein
MSRRANKDQQGIELPSWIFDVEDEDEIEGDASLLEELEIDPAHIYRYRIQEAF